MFCSTMAECLTHNAKTEGSNLSIDSEREKMVGQIKEVCLWLAAQW